MDNEKIFLGKAALKFNDNQVIGDFVSIQEEKYYRISNFNQMPDFFMTIVSDSDHWMFISSNGSLSAGRMSRDHALFPYYTEDKIHDYKGKTGSKTILQVHNDDKTFLWEPFTDELKKIYSIKRNLYKNIYGNKIIFEEINEDLGLGFRYGWFNSDKYGFIKKSFIYNLKNKITTVEILDGIVNILPAGIDYSFQNEFSNLLDAYKKNELVKDSSLGLFMLSSIPIDRAEPSEALKATTVWSIGLTEKHNILISEKQLNRFRKGLPVEPEWDIRASRGAYFINVKMNLEEGLSREWITIAEIDQDSTSVANLLHFIHTTKRPEDIINDNITKGTLNLKQKVSSADGFQITNTPMCYARHYSNTLYNIMRGGIFANNYFVDSKDFKKYVWQINRMVSKEYQTWLDNIPTTVLYLDLIKMAEDTENADLVRITNEYLPLTFSRRHGDPSRPWNQFSIETKNKDGSAKYNYEGNWRDIFQNWEALCFSYPEFVEGIISKFVNASTIDGYNPYRIMRKGIDWECPDPNDPWSYIGYWGDHQIIYLQKLLEISDNFHPGKIDHLLTKENFTYANVPYQIKSYSQIVQNRKDTVFFNEALNNQIKDEVAHLGADARLLKKKETNEVYKVNLTEKILVTLLTKMSNFIPEAGIWLNTQRPEWNDANNALVGNGASMVTLYYLRRFLSFWNKKLNDISFKEVSVSEEVAELLGTIHTFLKENVNSINQGFTDKKRKYFADHLGEAHGKYRNDLYNFSFSGEKKQVRISELQDFTQICLRYVDQSIKINQRADGLYHAYNLISINRDNISIRHLYEMLEGQVAVLSAGLLSPSEALNVLDALKKSKIFRADQYSYMLYPDRKLPRFIEKNNIPKEAVASSPLLKKLVEDHETSILEMDENGNCHFNSSFRNAEELKMALDNMRVGVYSRMIEDEKENVMAIYESLFDHQSFTGRSGTFYGYEGLGSIYWHMVSKLLLATQECYFSALGNEENSVLLGKLKDHYYEIKAGIGLYKSPDLYGAFPMDPYSHSPGGAGVKQPGLTGQVKEDVISRLGEMGIRIKNGEILFDPSLLNAEELLSFDTEFEYYSLDGDWRKIALKKKQFAFTFCQVPFICSESTENNISIWYKKGNKTTISDHKINNALSTLLFTRTGSIDRIEIAFRKDEIR